MVLGWVEGGGGVGFRLGWDFGTFVGFEWRKVEMVDGLRLFGDGWFSVFDDD